MTETDSAQLFDPKALPPLEMHNWCLEQLKPLGITVSRPPSLSEENPFWLKPYQVEGVRFILQARGRCLLADETGLGKTGQVYMAWQGLKRPSPALILAGKNAQYAWLRQAKEWDCPTPITIDGDLYERPKQWQAFFDRLAKGEKDLIVICTREIYKRDLKTTPFLSKIAWVMLITDEAQRDINRKTGNHQLVREVSRFSAYHVAVTASPQRKGPQDLWANLHCLDRKFFSSYWRFVETHLFVNKDGPYGWEILGEKPDSQLHKILARYMIQRGGDVAGRPRRTRIFEPYIRPDETQKKILLELTEDLIADLGDGNLLITPNEMTKILRMRQLLVCPKILNQSLGYGACVERLIELLDETSDRHCVVFTPFKAAFQPIAQAIQDAKLGIRHIEFLSGGLSTDDLAYKIKTWRNTKGIMVCTVQYAESFDLVPAKWAYFCGYEWSVVQNLQAEGRLDRVNNINQDGTPSAITYYYPTHEDCVDSQLIRPRLDQNVEATIPLLQRTKDFLAALHKQRDTLRRR